MLSQVLPDTTVIPSYRLSMSTLPRAKSAQSRQLAKLDNNEFNSTSARWPNKYAEDEDISPYYRRELSANNPNKYNSNEYSDEENEFTSSSGFYLQPKNAPSMHDMIRAKNTNERLSELEKTNLHLKRMLSLLQDQQQNQQELGERVGSGKLLANRETYLHKLGPPLLRQGRIGSTWRHIKQTNNYTNSNLLFIDGTVRINDSVRYPPRIYGYPPRQLDHRDTYDKQEFNKELVGLNSQSMSNVDFPIDVIRNRPLNLSAYENPFHTRAKQGFEYWTKDKRQPDNNRPKAAKIAIGHPYFKSGY